MTDLSGQRFERLVALYPVEIRKNRHIVFVCQCDCGEVSKVTNSNLRSGHTQSCGCLMIERIIETNSTHCWSGTPLYRRWTQMLQRCYLKTATNYEFYGARGITVCKRWRYGDGAGKTGFECFLQDMGEPPEGKWIERKNNNWGYSPRNCVWAEPRDQWRNTRRNVYVTHGGETMIVSDWERALGLRRDVVAKRLRRGMAVARAVETGVKTKGNPKGASA